MTLKKFVELFEKRLKMVEDVQEDLEDFVSYIATQNIELGKHKYACIKIRERILSRKYKTVRTELALWREEYLERGTFVVSIDSTVNNLRKPRIKYKNCRNISLREGTVYTDQIEHTARRFSA